VRARLRAERSEQQTAHPEGCLRPRVRRAAATRQRDDVIIEIARVSRKIRTEQAGRS
jgi:hypothetical protein